MNNNVLAERISLWKEMPRNNPVELKEADEYFDNVLMPLARDRFIETQKIRQSYYGMVLTLGTSWQPLALSISALRPEKILILCTEDTITLVDKLKDFVGIDDSCCKVAIVDRSECQGIYTEMKAAYEEWERYGMVCVDITGGTKAMSSSAAMMGAVLGMDIYYVESKYLPLYRRPEPGSEYLKHLSNPR